MQAEIWENSAIEAFWLVIHPERIRTCGWISIGRKTLVFYRTRVLSEG
jgi:hypothetical protein